MFYVYIIESKSTRKWYFGFTEDLVRRLDGHNKGLNVSTRNRGPWLYVFVRSFPSRTEATEFESYLKATRNKEFIRRKFSEYFLSEGGEMYPDASGPVSASR